MKIRKVISGRFTGEDFMAEGYIKDVMGDDSLPFLAYEKGNPTALNALEIDQYTINDAPFLYGKIGGLGYIISEKQLN